MVHGVFAGRRLLDRDVIHHAAAEHEDPVGTQAADLQPCRALLLPGMVDGEQGQLEAVLVGQLLERRVGFLAVGAVVEDMGDLLALQLVHPARSEEHTSELQSLMRISYAVFCLKKKNEELQNTIPNPLTQ